jgi:HSF-type DNA-binding
MIDRCDKEMATWSDSGDSFIIKDVDSFATNMLRTYFVCVEDNSLGDAASHNFLAAFQCSPILQALELFVIR